MKKNLFLFILIAVMASFSQAQTPLYKKQHNANWCGSSLQDNILIKERMIKNRTEMVNWVDSITTIVWVPIQFHIVTNDSGGDHVRELSVFDMLCAINEDYLDQNLQFFIKDSQFKDYYWRVKPLNLGNPCGPVTPVQAFKTGSIISAIDFNKIKEVKEWTVSPNPLYSD